MPKASKSGILNIRKAPDGSIKARLLYEKKGKQYNIDLLEWIKGYDDKRVNIRIMEIQNADC